MLAAELNGIDKDIVAYGADKVIIARANVLESPDIDWVESRPWR